MCAQLNNDNTGTREILYCRFCIFSVEKLCHLRDPHPTPLFSFSLILTLVNLLFLDDSK